VKGPDEDRPARTFEHDMATALLDRALDAPPDLQQRAEDPARLASTPLVRG
jgi:hypothetical protein